VKQNRIIAFISIPMLIAAFLIAAISCQNPATPDVTDMMRWKGYLSAAPSSPAANTAYYDTTLDGAYIWDGSAWKALSRDSLPSGTAISWKGELAAVPASPQSGWMYYNSADKKTYLYDGAVWQTIASDSVTAVSEIIWKGQAAAAPASPQLGWAYYNTTDGKTYLYDGTDWQTLASDQTQNVAIHEITWEGQLAAAPTTPVAGWAYYNTADKKTYMFDGAAWQAISSDQSAQTAAIVWRGSLAAAPSGPQANWAYYDTVLKQSRLWDGAAWQVIAKDGTVGQAGTSIVWKGSLSGAPASPASGWGYYNTTQGSAFIYDGSAWQIIAKDGGTSLNATASVAPGGYLPLAHGLARDDLTFTGQFLKDGRIYDYGQYENLFWQDSALRSRKIFEGGATNSTTTARSPVAPYNVLVAYKDATAGRGAFCIFNAQGELVRSPTTFSTAAVSYGLAATALASGDFLIAWGDDSDNARGYFKILSQDGGTVKQSQKFCDLRTGVSSCVQLSNGNILLAFDTGRDAFAGDCAFVIYDSTGASLIRKLTYASVSPTSGDVHPIALPSSGQFAYLWQNLGSSKLMAKAYQNDGLTEVGGMARTIFENCETTLWTPKDDETVETPGPADKDPAATGTNSMRINVPTSHSSRTLAYATYASPIDLSGFKQLGFWVKPNLAIDKAWLALRLDNEVDGNSIDYACDLPYMPANVWTYVTPTINSVNSILPNSVKYVDLYQNSHVFGTSFSIEVDEIGTGSARPLNANTDSGENNFAAARLAGGGILLAMSNSVDAGNGYVYTYDATAENCLMARQFETHPTEQYSLAALTNGTFAIAYRDTFNCIGEIGFLDGGGAPTGRNIVFSPYDSGTEGWSGNRIAALPDGMLAIAYRNTEDSNSGTMLWGGDYRLSLEKQNSSEVRLYNRTAETLTLYLSLDR
jgi:hypothetical protein